MTREVGLPLCAPPDGAILSGRELRERLLGDVEVVYALPSSGMLLIPGPGMRPSVAIWGDRLLLHAEPGREAPVVLLSLAERLEAERLWLLGWRLADAPPTDESSALVVYHHRGLLRAAADHGGVTRFVESFF